LAAVTGNGTSEGTDAMVYSNYRLPTGLIRLRQVIVDNKPVFPYEVNGSMYAVDGEFLAIASRELPDKVECVYDTENPHKATLPLVERKKNRGKTCDCPCGCGGGPDLGPCACSTTDCRCKGFENCKTPSVHARAQPLTVVAKVSRIVKRPRSMRVLNH
jgi:hypothetical protein